MFRDTFSFCDPLLAGYTYGNMVAASSLFLIDWSSVLQASVLSASPVLLLKELDNF